MLILVSTTVFVSVCTLLVAILFGASAQIVSSDILSSYSGGRGVVERWKWKVLKERAIATSKTSVASRLKYDIHLPGSGRDCEL